MTAITRSWECIQFVSNAYSRKINLGDYRYKTIRGIDFYRFALEKLSSFQNVEFRQGNISRIIDNEQGAQVMINGTPVSGRWVFDSRFKRTDFHHMPDCHHCMNLHFLGWEIETGQPVFDHSVATFLDFRTPQFGETRFFYLLPFAENRALVEYTLFTKQGYKKKSFVHELEYYIKNKLEANDYKITRTEINSIPITDRVFPRRVGNHVMNIGAKAGLIKPTTGFAFTRVQRDSAAIVNSLINYGNPSRFIYRSSRYRFYDTILLNIMSNQGHQIEGIFTALFEKNDARRIFRFLDEDASFWENIRLISTLPPLMFLKSFLDRKVLRKLKPLLSGQFSAQKTP